MRITAFLALILLFSGTEQQPERFDLSIKTDARVLHLVDLDTGFPVSSNSITFEENVDEVVIKIRRVRP